MRRRVSGRLPSTCNSPSSMLHPRSSLQTVSPLRLGPIANPKSRIPNEQGLSPRGRGAIVDFGLWILDCGFWIADCGLRIVDCGLWIADCGLRRCSVAQGAVLWCREDGRVEGWVEGYESALYWCMRYAPMLHQDLCRSNCRHATASVGEAAVSVQSSMRYAPSTIVTTNREPPSSRANRQSQIENPK